MFDTISRSVSVQKPDFVQLVSQLPVGTVAGCKWCFKTIFWNGSFWNHVDRDRHKCDRGFMGGPHNIEKVGHQEIEVGRTFFKNRPIMRTAPIHRCTDCGQQKVASFSGGYWFEDLDYDCPVKVATPAKPSTTDQSGGGLKK